MVIKRVCLINFGKFHNKVLDFSNGVNVLYGENEAGKTTLHTFIKGMLFGLDGKHSKNSEDSEYEKYLPWDNPNEYKGSMVIEADGEEYLIERNFLKTEKSYKITRISTDTELEKDEIEELFYGFDEGCYYNTISISQLGSITSRELEKVLKNYVSNLGSTKTTEINIEEALRQLEDAREKLIEEVGADQKEEIEEEIRGILAEKKELEAEEAAIIRTIEANRESAGKLKTKVKALEELDNVQTERQIKKNMNQENLLQRNEMLSADIERLMKDREQAEQHKKELKVQLDKHNVTSKLEIEKEIEGLLAKSNVSMICILIIVASLGLCAGVFFMDMDIVFSDYNTWIHEAVCLTVAVLFSIVFVISYFAKKNNKVKRLALLKELKLCIDRYEAAKSEYNYATRQIKAKQKDLNNISFRIKAEKDKPNLTSDYNTEIDEINGQVGELKEAMAKSRWMLEQKKESLIKANKQLTQLKEKLDKINSIKNELDAIEDAKNTINTISDEVRRSFGKALNEKASVYMGKITNGKYDNIEIDENMNIRIQSKFGISIAIEKLSKGTIEQLYMAIRLAAADIIFEEDKKPILLDDAFVMYDNKRMANTIRFMADNLSQVVIFSCHTREKIMADRLALKYKLILI